MHAIPFIKMHGLGNDFVVVDRRAVAIELDRAAIGRIADRHRGVGFDQLVVIDHSRTADARLAFFNADGSEAGACGNGTRCAARLLFEERAVPSYTLETDGGLLLAARDAQGRITVDMAAPRLDWQDIPLAVPCDTIDVPLEIAGLPHPVAVGMGNPHAVFFVDDLMGIDVVGLGAVLEQHPIFPERANIGFAHVLERDRLRLRVFERGAGLTLACGSGACAAVVAGVRRGLLDSPCAVTLDGGDLQIAWGGTGPVAMSGPTAVSFTGTLAAELVDG